MYPQKCRTYGVRIEVSDLVLVLRKKEPDIALLARLYLNSRQPAGPVLNVIAEAVIVEGDPR